MHSVQMGEDQCGIPEPSLITCLALGLPSSSLSFFISKMGTTITLILQGCQNHQMKQNL